MTNVTQVPRVQVSTSQFPLPNANMHLTILNQTEDDLCCSFQSSSIQGDHDILVKAQAKRVIFSSKCSLLVLSRHSRGGETKEHEAVHTSSVSVPMPLRANTGRRWSLVKVQSDSEWIVYRNRVRQCRRCSRPASVHAFVL